MNLNSILVKPVMLKKKEIQKTLEKSAGKKKYLDFLLKPWFLPL